MKGGVILFRGTGADARRYLESDRSRVDDYYLEGGTALAEFVVVDGRGAVVGEGALSADEYAQWVDWSIRSRASRWAPRARRERGGTARRGSRRWS